MSCISSLDSYLHGMFPFSICIAVLNGWLGNFGSVYHFISIAQAFVNENDDLMINDNDNDNHQNDKQYEYTFMFRFVCVSDDSSLFQPVALLLLKEEIHGCFTHYSHWLGDFLHQSSWSLKLRPPWPFCLGFGIHSTKVSWGVILVKARPRRCLRGLWESCFLDDVFIQKNIALMDGLKTYGKMKVFSRLINEDNVGSHVPMVLPISSHFNSNSPKPPLFPVFHRIRWVNVRCMRRPNMAMQKQPVDWCNRKQPLGEAEKGKSEVEIKPISGWWLFQILSRCW